MEAALEPLDPLCGDLQLQARARGDQVGISCSRGESALGRGLCAYQKRRYAPAAELATGVNV